VPACFLCEESQGKETLPLRVMFCAGECRAFKIEVSLWAQEILQPFLSFCTIKRLFPLFQREAVRNVGGGVNGSGGDHFEGALPAGEVLGDGAVDRKLFVDDFAPVNIHWLFNKGDLCEMTKWADDVEALVD